MRKFYDLTPEVKEKVLFVLQNSIVAIENSKNCLYGDMALSLSKEHREWLKRCIKINNTIRDRLITYISGKE